ncbi:MAG: hypothetical protein IPJ87_11895 [Flavobacteriales bacterium]|nr:hypothetical protein [Flavobacteriales bacterium]
MDDALAEEILEFIKADPRIRKKFKYITQLILLGHRAPELYDKEDIEKGCEGVMAMKLLKGAENARIYCREVYVRGKCTSWSSPERSSNTRAARRTVTAKEKSSAG